MKEMLILKTPIRSRRRWGRGETNQDGKDSERAIQECPLRAFEYRPSITKKMGARGNLTLASTRRETGRWRDVLIVMMNTPRVSAHQRRRHLMHVHPHHPVYATIRPAVLALLLLLVLGGEPDIDVWQKSSQSILPFAAVSLIGRRQRVQSRCLESIIKAALLGRLSRRVQARRRSHRRWLRPLIEQVVGADMVLRNVVVLENVRKTSVMLWSGEVSLWL